MRMNFDELGPDTCCWCFAMKLEELPRLLASFMRKEPNTSNMEQQAQQLVRQGFQTQELRQFINGVCRWGGYDGVAGRVLKNNTEQELRSSFKEAHAHAMSNNDIESIESLVRLKGLAVSFASKHLKFLAPDRAVVLDSVISARLGYAKTPGGYQSFVSDCRRILEKAIARKLEYPGWGRAGWRVSDVEMAIFEKLRS